MRFPAYAKQRDSGVKWLGMLPAHWNSGSLTRVADRVVVGIAEAATHAYADSGVPILRATNVRAGRIIGDILYITPEFAEGRGTKLINADDLVTVRTGNAGVTAVVPESLDGCQCFTMLITTLSELGLPAFYCYVLNSLPSQRFFSLEGWGTAQVNISVPILKALPVAIPPLEEQRVIVTYLDGAIARIDVLIEEQRRLIELLREKRQAVISRAVTKGLNAAVPMKESGVAWLGKVPAHWTIGPLKHFVKVLDGFRIPLSAEERGGKVGEFPYYGASGVIDWIDEYIFDDDLVLVSEDGANLVNRSTPIAFVARGRYWVNNHAHILKPMCDSLVFWAELIEVVDLIPFVTGSAQPKLTIEALANIVIAVPPTDEERALIERFIVRATKGLDELAVEAEGAMGLLKERRSALISAAVTGKIDVRGMVPQFEAA